MTIHEFGDHCRPKLLLIHGFQCPYHVLLPYINEYSRDFHVIVPILSGHDPQENREFVSFEKTAAELEDQLLSLCGEKLYAVYGMSLGGVLAARLWQNRRLTIENLIFDGSPLCAVPAAYKWVMRRFYLNVTHRSQKRDPKVLQQATRSIVPKAYLEDMLCVLDHMTDQTIINCVNGIGQFRFSPTDDQTTALYFFHGTAPNEMIAEKSARYLARHYRHVTAIRLKGKAHCEMSIFEPDAMIQRLNPILR